MILWGFLKQETPYFYKQTKLIDMKYEYKLGPKANSFTDSTLGISITPRESYVSDKDMGKFSVAFSKAIQGGQLVKIEVEESVTLEQLDIATASAEQIIKFTRDEIMRKFSFLDDEDTEIATACKNKKELVEFLLKARGEYELD